MPKKRQNIPPNETPAQRFIRLAVGRTNNLLRNYKALANLRGKRYQSTPEQRQKIDAALQAAHKDCITQMAATGPQTQEGFKLQ